MLIKLKSKSYINNKTKDAISILQENHKNISKVDIKEDSYIVIANYSQLTTTEKNIIDNILVKDAQWKIDISTEYKFANKKITTVAPEWQSKFSNEFLMIFGPCSLENEEQIIQSINFIKNNGITYMRAGAFKPRTSPYSFQGLKLEGLKICKDLIKDSNIKLVSEVLSIKDIEKALPYIDILQVGSRNMQNFSLLEELATTGKPIILKRSRSASLLEWLLAAEYMLNKGCKDIILCERGIRSFENSYRNTFDINAIIALKTMTHLPVIADPSHGTGNANMVQDLSLASIFAGANGLIVETHPNPQQALSDGTQSLNFHQAKNLITAINKAYNFYQTL